MTSFGSVSRRVMQHDDEPLMGIHLPHKAVPLEAVIACMLIAAILWMNVKATLLIMRDGVSERSQRLMQLALVWALPMIGATLVFAVHRPPEKHPGRYREPPDPGDDFGFPRFSGRRSGSDGDDD